MNDLQRLFKARGITMGVLAKALGLGEHMVQKNVLGVRKNRHIQEAVAAFVGMSLEQCFGPHASRHLRPLIECEISKKSSAYEGKLKAKYLASHTVAVKRKAVNV